MSDRMRGVRTVESFLNNSIIRQTIGQTSKKRAFRSYIIYCGKRLLLDYQRSVVFTPIYPKPLYFEQMLNLGEIFPDFSALSTAGAFNLYEYLGDNWGLVLSHPKDFTPVCTTEIGRLSQLSKEFDKRNVKVLLISCDSVDDHRVWIQDVQHYSQSQVPYPIIGDENGKIAQHIGMLDMGADKMITVRAVFVVGPDKKVKAIISYPASTGRNMDEVIRLIDSLQLTANRQNVVTPVDWKVGGDLIVKPGAQIDGQIVIELPSGKDYLKFVKNK